jgi:lipoate-protein ligase A
VKEMTIMGDWRLLPFETKNAFANMAIDEAVLKARIANAVPNTLRFYKWKPSAVSVGRFQSIEKEVQIGNCRKHSVDIVRRITGGGTVYHDTAGEITYCVVVAKSDLETESITEVYEKLYACIVKGLDLLGVKADFTEGNSKACPNLTVQGKKISGSSQSHKCGVVLQHGTLLTNVDLNKMFSLIRAKNRSYLDTITVARDRITSLTKEVGREVNDEEVCTALAAGFSQKMNVKMLHEPLTTIETNDVEKLTIEKYSRTEWNLEGEALTG